MTCFTAISTPFSVEEKRTAEILLFVKSQRKILLFVHFVSLARYSNPSRCPYHHGGDLGAQK
jgi:hypothetical protein